MLAPLLVFPTPLAIGELVAGEARVEGEASADGVIASPATTARALPGPRCPPAAPWPALTRRVGYPPSCPCSVQSGSGDEAGWFVVMFGALLTGWAGPTRGTFDFMTRRTARASPRPARGPV